MPMLRTKKALAKMQPGEKLLVQATDPHALRDLSQFADQTGNKLLSSGDISSSSFLLEPLIYLVAGLRTLGDAEPVAARAL